MARNRKHQPAAIRFGPSVKALLLCLLIGGSGLGYVWQKSQISDLGKQILKRERRLKDLVDQNEKLRKQLATLRSPRFLEIRIKELSLGLGPPPMSQVWSLPEPSWESSKPGPERQYVAQNRESPVLP